LFLMSRNRSPVPGMFKGMRASANPGGAGHAGFVKRFIATCAPDGTPVEIRTTKRRATVTDARVFPSVRRGQPDTHGTIHSTSLRLNLLRDAAQAAPQGDWSAGDGLALDELNERHLIKPFAIPRHWFQFGAFDWGFSHPFSFGWFAVDEEGTVYLVKSVHGWKLKPAQIAARILEACRSTT
jgi:hypothetical protein